VMGALSLAIIIGMLSFSILATPIAAQTQARKERDRIARPIGARIKVTVTTPSGPRQIYKTVNSGGSFGSNPLRQEFGLGNATSITSVEILWPATGHNKDSQAWN